MDPDAHVRLLRLLRLQQNGGLQSVADRGQERRWCGAVAANLEIGLNEGDRFIVGHWPRNGHDQVAQQVVLFEVAQQVVARQGPNGRLGPPHVAAERMIRPADLLEQAMHVLLRRILVHTQLLEHNQPLLLQLGGIEQRLEQHVPEDVDGQLGLGLGHARPVHRELLVRRCVQNAAHALDRLCDLLGAAVAGRAFEEHVFEEMADPGFVLRLIPRTDLEHDRHRDRGPVGQLGRDDSGPGRQGGKTIRRTGLGHGLSIS